MGTAGVERAPSIGGGILSVLPVGLFPFEPEQSWKHYAFHLVYTVTQVPLVWICIAWLLRSRRAIALVS